jgi:hypothetical protein
MVSGRPPALVHRARGPACGGRGLAPSPAPTPRVIATTVHCSGSPGEWVVFMGTIASREGLAIRIRTRNIR